MLECFVVLFSRAVFFFYWMMLVMFQIVYIAPYKAMTPRSEYDVIVSPLRDQYTLKGNSCKVKLFTFSIDQRHMTAL